MHTKMDVRGIYFVWLLQKKIDSMNALIMLSRMVPHALDFYVFKRTAKAMSTDVFVKSEPMDEDCLPTVDNSQVGQLAENEALLQCMLENRKKANVYQVKSKEELFGNKTNKSTKANMKTNKMQGSHRRHIVEGKNIPVNLVKKRSAPPSPEPPQVELKQWRQNKWELNWVCNQFVKEYGSTVLALGAIGTGVYLLYQSKKEVVDLVKEGSSIE